MNRKLVQSYIKMWHRLMYTKTYRAKDNNVKLPSVPGERGSNSF